MLREENVSLDESERLEYIAGLDDELLKGGAAISEWSAVIVRECDCAFVAGANLATVILAVAAIETYLRAEYSGVRRERLADLVDRAPISQEIRDSIHKLRKFRNVWVHVATPEGDQSILANPDEHDSELEKWAIMAQRTLRQTVYENPWI